MASAVKMIWDRAKFTRALREYSKYSKRDNATICNTKAFYIARRATVETGKANKGKIHRDLLKKIVTSVQIVGYKVRFTKTKGVRRGGAIQGAKTTAPFVAMILNARRRRHGEKGLYGTRMEAAVNELIAARDKSVAFLKSGWISAIKRLEPFAEKIGGSKPRQDRAAEQIGGPKGSASPAKEGDRAITHIFNTATARHTNNEGGMKKLAIDGLAKAFEFERQSMLQYIERKKRESAKKAGIKTN